MVLPADQALMESVVARVSRPDYARFAAQLRSSNNCARPILLRGKIERRDAHGRREVEWSTDSEPDKVLRIACGNRREAQCPPCAELYGGDAYQLVFAGLGGGKGVPATVAEHPAVFVTLTAPSFGVVHTRRIGRDGQPLRCRPRRDAPTCAHGVRLSCGQVHDENDPCLGEPLCLECYDHEAAVVWNNTVSELWRRTTIYLPRRLAAILGVTQKRVREQVRFSYIKVAEYQQRGLIHFHAVMRLDRAMPKYRAGEIKPPPLRFTVQLLEQTVRDAAQVVFAPLPAELGGGQVRWGDELDIAPIGGSSGLEARHTAGYLAKYATKSTELAGGVLHRVNEDEIDRLPVSEHVRAYLRAAFALAYDSGLLDRRFRRYAHAFGYRGHCLTKSRLYSTTFKALRAAREQHVHEQLRQAGHESQHQLAADDLIKSFQYVGQGHFTPGDALLASSAAARALGEHSAARESFAIAATNHQRSEGRTCEDQPCPGGR